jgi:DNA-binding transcriptional regulator YbjK
MAASSAKTSPGIARREKIIEATIRLVARDGTGGLTHRKVAREAGVPLAATTYYFESKEALFQETLASVAEAEIARLRDLMTSPARGDVTQRLLEVFAGQQSASSEAWARIQLAQYELFLEAGRRPKVRPIARAWTQAYLDLAEEVLAEAGSSEPARDAQNLVAMVDGLFLEQVATRRRGFKSQTFEPALRRFVSLTCR